MIAPIPADAQTRGRVAVKCVCGALYLVPVVNGTIDLRGAECCASVSQPGCVSVIRQQEWAQ